MTLKYFVDENVDLIYIADAAFEDEYQDRIIFLLIL